MKVCIVGLSGKLGQYMVRHALDSRREFVGINSRGLLHWASGSSTNQLANPATSTALTKTSCSAVRIGNGVTGLTPIDSV